MLMLTGVVWRKIQFPGQVNLEINDLTQTEQFLQYKHFKNVAHTNRYCQPPASYAVQVHFKRQHIKTPRCTHMTQYRSNNTKGSGDAEAAGDSRDHTLSSALYSCHLLNHSPRPHEVVCNKWRN